MIPYENLIYAAGRLQDTIVRTVTGRAIHVHGLDNMKGQIQANCSFLTNPGQVEWVPMKDIDLDPVPLGFVNSVVGLSYWARTPMRNDWRQGARRANCRSLYGVNKWDERAIGLTVEGKFPSIDKIAERINKAIRDGVQPKAEAFDRQFAIDGEGSILYRSFGRVGRFVDLKKRDYALDNDKLWVEDALKKVLA